MYDNRNAMSLHIGDEILNSDGQWVKIYSIEYRHESIKTYTFTVDSSFHNYFANSLLVSNAQDCLDPAVPSDPQEKQDNITL